MDCEEEGRSGRQRVRVAIRVRPPTARELPIADQGCIECLNDNEVGVDGNRVYSFDHVFGQHSQQEEIYTCCVREVALKCLEGYNGAVLAYGQTGSGKTYTMGTTPQVDSQEGIVPRVINELFSQAAKKSEEAVARGVELQVTFKVSFVELYNQQFVDLLEERGLRKEISVREEKDGSVNLHGAIEMEVSSAKDMHNLLMRGGIQRTTTTTLMNQASSRSHAVFSIGVERKEDKTAVHAYLHLVDLAGSERSKKTGATGLHFREGININLSLLQLGNVISALAARPNETQFISYRNSKLTRLLQNTLGGNSNTVMIACVSPSDSNMEQSLNTLNYAAKAMNIKNKPRVNRDPHSALLHTVAQLTLENQQLLRALNAQNQGNPIGNLLNGHTLNGMDFSRLTAPIFSGLLCQKCNQLKEKQTQFRNRIQELKAKGDTLFKELTEEKGKYASINVANYELRRENDLHRSRIEALLKRHPQLESQLQIQPQLIDDYLRQITMLESEVREKEEANRALNDECSKLDKIIQRNQEMLLKKNAQMRETNRLLKELQWQLNGKSVEDMEIMSKHTRRSQQLSINTEGDSRVESEYGFQENNRQNVYHTQLTSNQSEQELKSVNKFIDEKEGQLREMANQQVQMELKLLSEMQKEYHNKISELEQQRYTLVQLQKQGSASSKLTNKINKLQTELKELRGKVSQQSALEKQITTQTSLIKQLSSQITSFKVQRVELNRKIKEDRQGFNKLRTQHSKEMLKVKQQQCRKELQLRKVTAAKQRNEAQVERRVAELSRIKEINQTLKRALKGKVSPIDEAGIAEMVQSSVRQLLYRIDHVYNLEQSRSRCVLLERQIGTLAEEEVKVTMKLLRNEVTSETQRKSRSKEDVGLSEQEKRVYQLREEQIRNRISNLEQSLSYCRKKVFEREQAMDSYDLDVEVLLNRQVQSIDAMRAVASALYAALQQVLSNSYEVKMESETLKVKTGQFQMALQQCQQLLYKERVEHEETVVKIREELTVKCLEEGLNIETGPQAMKSERKGFDKKLYDLSKINAKLSGEIQMLRRKCNIIQEKYNGLRNLFHKDRFIGRQGRDEIQKSKDQTIKNVNTNREEGRIEETEEIDTMIEQLHGRNERIPFRSQRKKPLQQELCRWECSLTIQAHSSPVLSLATMPGLLLSGATRCLRMWNIETGRIQAQLNTFPSFVKSIAVNQDRRAFFTACDKQVVLWDLRTFQPEITLRAYRDEIRTMQVVNNMLITGGKGLTNNGSLLVWDLRSSMTVPLQEKERNQDVLALTAVNNVLYYGTRDHHVRRMSLESFQMLTAFQPPHMDAVTGLAGNRGHLLSGSKDHTLRLWSLQSSIGNLKSTILASNDYFNCVQSDPHYPLFFSGDRSGQIRVSAQALDRLNIISIFGHSQSVNALCPLSHGFVASGSSDSTLKLWKPDINIALQLENKFGSL